MIRRILFGLLWCFVFYFLACAVTGGIVGGMAGSRDPENAAVAGAQEAARVVTPLRGYFLIGSGIFSAVGVWVGYLPGTRPKRPAQLSA